MLARGLMHYDGRALRLTPEGEEHFNGVVALFYAPSVKAWLLAARAGSAGPGASVARRVVTAGRAVV